MVVYCPDFFFFYVNFLFPLVTFKGSLQGIDTQAKIVARFMLTFSLSATDKTGRGGVRDKGMLLWGGAAHLLLTPGEAFAKSTVVFWGIA